MEVFTTKNAAEFYINLNNEYVNEFIERRSMILGSFEYDFAKLIEDDLDLIFERKNVLIPIFFNLSRIWSSKNNE